MHETAARLVVVLACLVCMSPQASAGKRVALVIGNAAYKHTTPLRNPKNDADAIAKILVHLDFKVLKGTDLTHRQFGRTVAKFRKALAGADVALLFYAGHGLQVHGHNYLAPVDAQLEDEDSLEFEAVRLRAVLALMEREPRTNLVFLDACRDNPMARNLARNLGTRSTSVGRGFAREEGGIGTMIAFATQPGNVALDGEDKHSPFTKALLKHIETPGQDIANLMRRVRLDVINATSSRQVPWNNSSLTAPFIFKTKPKEDPSAKVELAFWKTVEAKNDAGGFQQYLDRYPTGRFATLANIRIEELQYEIERVRRDQERAELARLRAKIAAEAAEKERAAKALTKRKAEFERAEAERKKREEDGRRQLKEERAKFEAERKAVVERASDAEEKQIAALSTDQSITEREEEKPATESALDPRSLALALQNELLRVGCNPGQPDGVWGRKGRAALDNFNRHANTKLRTDEPTEAALEALKKQSKTVCSLKCRQGDRIVGGRCVPKVKSAGKKKTVQKPIKRAEKKKPAAPVSSRRKKCDPADSNPYTMGCY